MTIKREITKNATTKNTTVKATENKNAFKLNEKSMVLTLTIPVEYNKTGTSLKIKDLETDPKGYKYMVATDIKGNSIKLFKTGFEYEPKIKTTKPLAVDPTKMSKLDKDEQDVLLAILAKLQ